MNTQLSKRHVEFLKSGQLTSEVPLVAALIILMLSVGAHLFDFLGVFVLADVSSILFVREAVVLGIVSGILALQVCLLAIWCSLGGQRGIWRLPLATTSLILLINNWVLAIGAGRSSLNSDDVAVVFVGVFSVFVLVQLPLLIIRGFYKMSIVPNGLISTRSLPSHFRIRDLFVLMFSAALLVVFTQVVVDIAVGNLSNSLRNINFSRVIEASGVFLKFGVSVSFISLLALGVVFSKKYRWRFVLLILFLVITAGALGSSVFFSNAANQPRNPLPVEIYQWVAFLNVVFWGELVVLSAFYFLGYRARLTQRPQLATSR